LFVLAVRFSGRLCLSALRDCHNRRQYTGARLDRARESPKPAAVTPSPSSNPAA